MLKHLVYLRLCLLTLFQSEVNAVDPCLLSKMSVNDWTSLSLKLVDFTKPIKSTPSLALSSVTKTEI